MLPDTLYLVCDPSTTTDKTTTAHNLEIKETSLRAALAELTPGPDPAHNLLLYGSQLRRVFILLNGSISTRMISSISSLVLKSHLALHREVCNSRL